MILVSLESIVLKSKYGLVWLTKMIKVLQLTMTNMMTRDMVRLS